jgi:hypothetical protein
MCPIKNGANGNDFVPNFEGKLHANDQGNQQFQTCVLLHKFLLPLKHEIMQEKSHFNDHGNRQIKCFLQKIKYPPTRNPLL